jgi:uncharacterized membrane protein YphA (DoxX/SURF4 family)
MQKAIDGLLFDTFRTSVRTQAIYRIVFSLFLLISISPNSQIAKVQHWSRLPGNVAADAFYPTLGPAMALPPPTVVAHRAVNVLMLVGAYLLLIGLYTRPVSLLLSLGFVLTRMWVYTSGKVDHDILFVITPACLAFSRWGDDLSVDSLRNAPDLGPSDRDAWPFAMLAILVAFGMANSGLQKALGGWLSYSDLAVVSWIVYAGEFWEKSSVAYSYLETILSSPWWMLKSLDFITVFFEIGFIIAIWRRSTFQMFCLCAILFHFGTKLLFDIYFRHQLIVYVAFFSLETLWPTGVTERLSKYPFWLQVTKSRAAIIITGLVVAAIVVASRRIVPYGGLIQFGSVALATVGLVALCAKELRALPVDCASTPSFVREPSQ